MAGCLAPAPALGSHRHGHHRSRARRTFAITWDRQAQRCSRLLSKGHQGAGGTTGSRARLCRSLASPSTLQERPAPPPPPGAHRPCCSSSRWRWCRSAPPVAAPAPGAQGAPPLAPPPPAGRWPPGTRPQPQAPPRQTTARRAHGGVCSKAGGQCCVWLQCGAVGRDRLLAPLWSQDGRAGALAAGGKRGTWRRHRHSPPPA